MRKTSKGRLTVSMIGIVVIRIFLTTVGIIAVAGKRMIQDQTQALKLNGEKYAEEINTWIENEKMPAYGAVMKQMEELFRLSELLNRTVASFRV